MCGKSTEPSGNIAIVVIPPVNHARRPLGRPRADFPGSPKPGPLRARYPGDMTTSTQTPVTPLQPAPDALNLLKPESNGASCCGGTSCGTN